MIQKFIKVVFKDVENENETKKVSVILRLNAIIMFIYFICILGVFLMTGICIQNQAENTSQRTHSNFPGQLAVADCKP